MWAIFKEFSKSVELQQIAGRNGYKLLIKKSKKIALDSV